MAYTNHPVESSDSNADSTYEHKELVNLAQKRINSDRLLTAGEINELMGINISHQRTRMAQKAAEDKIERTKLTKNESTLIVILTVGISIGIGVLSMQFL